MQEFAVAFVAEEWMHECKRTTKRDGIPVFDGYQWMCSRCEMCYGVDCKNGATQERAEKSFWSYLANVCFVRRPLDNQQ